MQLTSCDNGKENPSEFVLDNDLNFYLKDNTGSNLLNTANYLEENFRVYNLINGEVIEVFNPMMDYPRNFFIKDESNPISMRLFLNNSDTEEFPVTYIKWNGTDTDTIKASYVRSENSVVLDQVWINDVLTPRVDDTYGNPYTIVK